MQPALRSSIPDASLAVFPVNGENSHRGLAGRNPAPNQVREVCNFTVLLGMRGQAEINRVGSRSPGKERDTESGNDYFGARYYASSMGRFLSPDPFLNSGRPDDPQTWNRYTYGLNNPLKVIDPTGLYNLVNTCDSGDKKCNKQFDQNAAKLKAGLEALNKALDDPATAKALGAEAVARLSEGLAAMGTENDGNNVDVKFGATSDGAAAQTDPSYNAASDSYKYTVTFDPSKNGSVMDYAINGDHEGMHAFDFSNYMRGATTTESPFQLEYRGYQNSSWAAQALGQPNISFRNTQIWNSSWGAVDRETLRDRGITKVVTDPNHPETQPHNPNPQSPQ